jgi:hypothetical protein
VVKSYAAIITGEGRYLLPPTKVIAACTMSKYYRWALAVGLVVELNTVNRSFGHRTSPLSLKQWVERSIGSVVRVVEFVASGRWWLSKSG